MDSRLPKRVTKTATGMALVAGLVVVLGSGAAQASGPDPANGNSGGRDDRVILKSNKVGAQAAATATLALSASAPRIVSGVGARVTATYSCPQGFDGYLDVNLDEVTKGHVSHGFGSNPKALTCDGVKHAMNVTVVVYNDWPLAAGKAFGRGVMETWDQNGGVATAATERAITVT